MKRRRRDDGRWGFALGAYKIGMLPEQWMIVLLFVALLLIATWVEYGDFVYQPLPVGTDTDEIRRIR